MSTRQSPLTHLEELSRQMREALEILRSDRYPDAKYCLSVEELAVRWMLGTETIRRLVRDGKLRPLHTVRPFRFTLAEVRRFEALDEAVDTEPSTSARRPRN